MFKIPRRLIETRCTLVSAHSELFEFYMYVCSETVYLLYSPTACCEIVLGKRVQRTLTPPKDSAELNGF